MLDLETGVHLHEVIRSPLDEELHRAGSPIGEVLKERCTRPRHRFPHGVVKDRRGRFLHQLLVVPLDGTIPLSEMENVPVPVPEQLDLHMPGVLKKLLHIHRIIAEKKEGFLFGEQEIAFKLRFFMNDPHSPSASSGGGFEDHRVPQPGSPLLGGSEVIKPIGTGSNGQARPLRADPGLNLVSQQLDRLRPRADEDQAGLLNRLGKRSALA